MNKYSLVRRYFYYAEIEWFPAKSYFILFNPDRVLNPVGVSYIAS